MIIKQEMEPVSDFLHVNDVAEAHINVYLFKKK